jgi:glycosyltransferase involved in cell wall biosynthesis
LSGTRVAMLGLRAPYQTEGGVEAAVGALAPRLVTRGFPVTVYCRRRYNPLGEGLHQGVRLVDVDTVHQRALEAIVHTARAMPQAIRDNDLVHIHATGPALLSWVPRLRGRRTVVTVHGLDWQRAKWGPIARVALRAGARAAGTFPHRVITVSQDLARHYRDAYDVDATWIPNGVDSIAPEPLEAAGVEGLQAKGYLLFVGRLVPEKGLDRLLEAYGQARLALPLVVVGPDLYSEDYAAGLRRDAPPGVLFPGARTGAARDALLTHARAVVLPSRLEGFPLVALEALAAGRPVLLSDLPPHRELAAGPGAAGVTVVPDDGWVQALRAVAEAPQQALDQAGEAGRRYVAAQYSWDSVADRTAAVYRS